MPNVEKLLGKAISFFVHGSKCRNLVSVPKTFFFHDRTKYKKTT